MAWMVGCTQEAVPRPDLDELTETEAWDYVRAAVQTPSACFNGDLRYCAEDLAYLDARIQATLDAHNDGRMPSQRRQLYPVVNVVRHRYRASLITSGVAEARIRANWEDPEVTEESGSVRVELGLPPGEVLSRGPRTFVDSPIVVEGELRTDEVVMKLSHFVEAHPAATVRLLVEIPVLGEASTRRLEYRWTPRFQAVQVLDPATPKRLWTSAPVTDLEAIDAGELRIARLHECKTEGYGQVPQGCVPAAPDRREP